MSTFRCTRCEGTGFLNLWQVEEDVVEEYKKTGDPQIILDWINERDALMKELGGCSCCICPPCTYCVEAAHDVQVCDCCGNGFEWYNEPGVHDRNNSLDPKGCR